MATTHNPRSGFWLHNTYSNGKLLLDLADDLGSTPAGRPGVAIAPVNARRTTGKLFQRARAGGDAIIDPHGHILDNEWVGRIEKHYPWLEQVPRPSTQAEWLAWMQKGIDDQTATSLVGTGSPSFIITPSPSIRVVPADNELKRVLAAATTHLQASNGDYWLGLQVEQTYVRDANRRSVLVAAILGTGATGIVFSSPQREQPPVKVKEYLNGFKDVIEQLVANGLKVHLPKAGWLGWLAMGWGAWGFSGGLPAETWSDRLKQQGGTPTDEPTRNYFEPQLLRTVRWDVHEDLANENTYVTCTCVECGAGPVVWDELKAKRHQMRHANDEASALVGLAVGQRATSIGARLDAAITFRDKLPVPLKRRTESRFLDVWRGLI